jgi:hypothetical protein
MGEQTNLSHKLGKSLHLEEGCFLMGKIQIIVPAITELFWGSNKIYVSVFYKVYSTVLSM